MKWLFNDPTAKDFDQMPLTEEESKAILMGAGLMACILVIAGVIIYWMTCK